MVTNQGHFVLLASYIVVSNSTVCGYLASLWKWFLPKEERTSALLHSLQEPNRLYALIFATLNSLVYFPLYILNLSCYNCFHFKTSLKKKKNSFHDSLLSLKRKFKIPLIFKLYLIGPIENTYLPRNFIGD